MSVLAFRLRKADCGLSGLAERSFIPSSIIMIITVIITIMIVVFSIVIVILLLLFVNMILITIMTSITILIIITTYDPMRSPKEDLQLQATCGRRLFSTS